MFSRQKKEIFDPSTHASLPAEYRLTRAEYARYCGTTFWRRQWRYASSFLPRALRKFPLLKNGYHYRYLQEWFLFGNLTPAAILDAKHRLVASFTVLDTTILRTGQFYRFPVIRVLKERLSLMPETPRDGQRVAGISAYMADENSRRLGRWKTFTPIIIDCICTNPRLCERIKAKIPQMDWQGLDLGLAQIPYPAKEGLYNIKLPPELLAASGSVPPGNTPAPPVATEQSR